MFYDVAMNFVIGTILMVAGAIMIWIPNRIFTGILIASIAFLCVNGVVLFILSVYSLQCNMNWLSGIKLTW